MPKLQETKGRYFITIPNGMVQRKKWTKGKDLFFTWNERGNIESTSSREQDHSASQCRKPPMQ